MPMPTTLAKRNAAEGRIQSWALSGRSLSSAAWEADEVQMATLNEIEQAFAI